MGAALAALVLENATGISYAEFTDKYIFQPLQMSKSGWCKNDVDKKNHSVLYLADNTPVPFYDLNTYPDGGLISCTGDLSN